MAEAVKSRSRLAEVGKHHFPAVVVQPVDVHLGDRIDAARTCLFKLCLNRHAPRLLFVTPIWGQASSDAGNDRTAGGDGNAIPIRRNEILDAVLRVAECPDLYLACFTNKVAITTGLGTTAGFYDNRQSDGQKSHNPFHFLTPNS